MCASPLPPTTTLMYTYNSDSDVCTHMCECVHINNCTAAAQKPPKQLTQVRTVFCMHAQWSDVQFAGVCENVVLCCRAAVSCVLTLLAAKHPARQSWPTRALAPVSPAASKKAVRLLTTLPCACFTACKIGSTGGLAPICTEE